jgi:hypothetical protein
MTLFSKTFGAASAIAMSCAAVAAQADVLFWSTQARPAEEAQAMTEQVLSGFAGRVDYHGSPVCRLNCRRVLAALVSSDRCMVISRQ